MGDMFTANQTPKNMENLKHLIRLLYRVRNYTAAARRVVVMSSVFPDSLVRCEELDSISN